MPAILLSTFPKFITSSCGKQPARLELPARIVPGLPTGWFSIIHSKMSNPFYTEQRMVENVLTCCFGVPTGGVKSLPHNNQICASSVSVHKLKKNVLLLKIEILKIEIRSRSRSPRPPSQRFCIYIYIYIQHTRYIYTYHR